MKPSDIIAQIMASMPRFTDRISISVGVTSLTRSGTTVTVVTDAVHGLTTNDTVLISGVDTPVLVSTLSHVDGLATGVTSENHDLTEDFTNQITVSGADQAEYNGSFDLVSTINRKTFQYNVDSGAVTPATGTILLFDGKERGYNGTKTVTVVNTTTFTYEITGTPYDTPGGTVTVHTGINVGASVDIESFIDAYTQATPTNDTVWLCVVMNDATASNNRFIETDAIDRFSPGTDYRQKIAESFSVFMIIPSAAELTGVDARDEVEDLKLPLLRSLLGFQFPSYLSISKQFGTTLLNHGFFGYTGAYYVHEFVFEMVTESVFDDIVDPDLNVAFRDIILRLQNEFKSVIMTSDIDLDDEPLDP